MAPLDFVRNAIAPSNSFGCTEPLPKLVCLLTVIVLGANGLFSEVGMYNSCSEVKIVRNLKDCNALISDT